MSKIYKNWFVHNCIGHPLYYFIGFVSESLAKHIHDSTLPSGNLK